MRKLSGCIYTLAFVAIAQVTPADFQWKDIPSIESSQEKPTLLYFTIDGIPLCREMEEDVLPEARVRSLIGEHFHPVRIDAQDRLASDLLRQHKVIAVPTLLILTEGTEDRRLTRNAKREDVIAFLNDEEPVATETSSYSQSQILMSGSSPADFTGQEPIDLTSATVSRTEGHLIFSMSCVGEISENKLAQYQFLVNSDNNPATGFQSGDFSGGDFLIQGAQTHRFTGSAPDEWSWEFVAATDYQITGNKLIQKVSRSVIDESMSSAFAMTQDDNWNILDSIIMVAGNEDTTSSQKADQSQETNEKFFDDPANNEISGSDDIRKVWMANFKETLEIALQFREVPTFSGIHLFLNSDSNNETGYVAGDKQGADFMVEGSLLYGFTGATQTEWNWTPIAAELNTKMIPSGLRFSIPKSRASIRENQPLQFWIAVTDDQWEPVEYFPKVAMREYFVGSTR